MDGHQNAGKQNLLIFLCWFVYMTAYLGRYSYTANVSQIEAAFGVTHAQSGLVTTCFFVAYGAGQAVSAFLCGRYPRRYVLSGALVLSAFLNLSLALAENFSAYKYLWLCNGVAQSTLYSSLILTIGENIRKEHVGKAVFAMGTAGVSGLIFCYALSALFVRLGMFRCMFYAAAGMLLVSAGGWFFGYRPLTKEPVCSRKETASVARSGQKRGGLIAFVLLLAFFAVCNNLIKEGMMTWAPSVMMEVYGLSDSVSILFTIVLPCFGLLGTGLMLKLNKLLRGSYLANAGLLFLGTAGLCAAIVCMLNGGGLLYLPAVVCVGAVNCLMVGMNMLLTTLIPLRMRGRISSGLLSGLLDASCYVGSAISSYGIGAVADEGGWIPVFWAFAGVAAAAFAISAVGLCISAARPLKAKKADGAEAAPADSAERQEK